MWFILELVSGGVDKSFLFFVFFCPPMPVLFIYLMAWLSSLSFINYFIT